MGHVEEIRQMAAHLGVNYSTREVCPRCGGGSTEERSLAITREATGLRWVCYRASCSERGSTIEMGELLPDTKPADTRKPLRPFTGRLHQLEQADFDYFAERFKLDELLVSPLVRLTDRGEYAFDIDDPLEHTRGVLVRQPVWGGLPKAPRVGQDNPDYPKTMAYMHARGPMQAWYNAYGRPSPIVVVEDCVSAMRLVQSGIRAVAILGTYLDAERVREIAQQQPKEVIIALDKDATASAFKLAQRWGLAWRKTRVAILEDDIKDMESTHDILEVLGLC